MLRYLNCKPLWKAKNYKHGVFQSYLNVEKFKYFVKFEKTVNNYWFGIDYKNLYSAKILKILFIFASIYKSLKF